MRKLFSIIAAACMALTMSAQVQQYNVAEAIAAAGENQIATNDSIAVRGVVTKIEFKGKNFAKYGSVNIYVADATGAEGAFEFYNCYSLAADTFRTSDPAYDATSTAWVQFNSVTDGNGVTVHVGDTVIAEGKYTLFNTTYELAQACYLTSIIEAVVEPEPVIEAISVAEAIMTTMALPDSTTSTDVFVVEGYVVNAGDFSWGSKQQIFFLADDAANTANQQFEAYYCTAMEDNVAMPVLNGDKVQLKGKLTKYVKDGNVTPEIKNGIATFISKVDGDRSQPVGDQITVAQALTYGANVAVGTTSTETYTIVGYVTAYDGKNEDGGWEQYGNQIFWIADTQGSTAKSNADGGFEVYQGVSAEKVNIGDKVSVVTKIKNYNGLLESEQRAPVTILEKAGDEVEDADVVFTSEEFNGLGTSGTGSEVNVVKDGVTFNCDKAFGDQYGVRCYKTSNVTITSAEQQIGKIVFEFATVNGTYYNGGLEEEIVVNAMEWKAEGLASQARMNKVKIYFGEYEKPIVADPDTITVAEALEIGNILEDNATTEREYVVKGWVVKAYAPNEGYTDQTWFMADEQGAFGEFEAYLCTPDYLVENDQFVYVRGKIQKYVKDAKVQIEISKGTATHPYGQGIENVTLTEKAQKVVVDGVIYIIRDNKMFNLNGVQVR